MSLHRYWVEFDVSFGADETTGLVPGCGITARTSSEALALVEDALGRDSLPSIKLIVEDVDVSALDPDHVQPNVGDPARPGVWYPALQRSR